MLQCPDAGACVPVRPSVGMTGSLQPLPEFDNPPVVEVILAVAFEPAYQLPNVALVEIWQELFKSTFPHVTEHPPYEVRRETFGIQVPSIELVAGIGPPPIRFWFGSEDDQEVIQMQHDWFGRNWRKIESQGIYPRYENYIRPAFDRDCALFVECVKKLGLEPTITQCEITYINDIPTGKLLSSHGDIPRILRLFDVSDYDLTLLESLDLRLSSKICSPDGQPVGRLHTHTNSAFDSRGQPIVRLIFTARGGPIRGDDRGAALRFLDIGRESIVRSFVAITSDESHREWRRTQ